MIIRENQNDSELINGNDNVSDKELSLNNELGTGKEFVAEKETDGDGEKKVEKNEESDDNGEDSKDDNQGDESTEGSDSDGSSSGSSAGGAGGAVGAVGGVAVAVIAVVVVIVNAISGVIASFNSLNVFGTFFDFDLTITMVFEDKLDSLLDFKNIDTGLLLVVSKNNFEYTEKLNASNKNIKTEIVMTPKEGEENKFDVTMRFIGTIGGLNENTRYKLTVLGDENGKTVTYLSDEIKTTSKVSTFNGISSYCSCAVDGNFNFSLDFTDEKGYYSEFIYEFINAKTLEVSASGEITEPHSEQHIVGVDEYTDGVDYLLKVSFMSTAPTDLQAENVVTEYDNVKITVNKGYVTIVTNVKI